MSVVENGKPRVGNQRRENTRVCQRHDRIVAAVHDERRLAQRPQPRQARPADPGEQLVDVADTVGRRSPARSRRAPRGCRETRRHRSSDRRAACIPHRDSDAARAFRAAPTHAPAPSARRATTSSLLPSTITRNCFAACTISDWSGGGTRNVSAVATSRNEMVTSGFGCRPARDRTRASASAYQRPMLPSLRRIWATMSCRRMCRRNSASTRAHAQNVREPEEDRRETCPFHGVANAAPRVMTREL
jgi:hypothetical protein